MPSVGNKLSYGGRHNTIFRDSLVQRSLIIKGTAAIRRVEAEDVETDRLTIGSTTISGIDTTATFGSNNLITSDAVYDMSSSSLLYNNATFLMKIGGIVSGNLTVTGTLTGRTSGNVPLPNNVSANDIVKRNSANDGWEFIGVDTTVTTGSNNLVTSGAVADSDAALFDFFTLNPKLPLSGGAITGNLSVSGTLTGTASGNVPLPSGTPSAGDVVKRNSVNTAWEYGSAQIAPKFVQTSNDTDDNLVNHGDNSPSSGDVSTDSNDWRKFQTWDTTGGINTDSNYFTIASNHVTVKIAGYYRVTCQLHVYSASPRVVVGSRVAKNDVMEGPVSCSTYIRAAHLGHFNSSTTVSHTISCAIDDTLSVFTSRFGSGGAGITTAGYSQLRVEFLGV